MSGVQARPAATVVLCRDGDSGGVEVYLQRRPARMGFAGGLWVFPGGRVDDADQDPAVDAHWLGPPPAAWAQRLDVAMPTARGYVVAACRETFEEAGVLLGAPPLEPTAAAQARTALLAGERTFAQVVADLGVPIDTALLRYWAWWVTPEAEPRRYDTRFFVALLAPDTAVSPHAGEVVDQTWASAPIDGQMLPPTRHTLQTVTALGSADAVMAAGADRPVTRVQPTIVDGRVVLPWGERHDLPGSPPS